MEPFPTPNFITQDIAEILMAVGFVERIIFGRMNHNKKVSEYHDYKQFYNQQASRVQDFCKKNEIELYVKKGTITQSITRQRIKP